jgi:hypothetical protein
MSELCENRKVKKERGEGFSDSFYIGDILQQGAGPSGREV